MGKRQHAEDDIVDHTATPNKRAKIEAAAANSVAIESPQQFQLTKEIVHNEVLQCVNLQKWRVGKPVGKGNFGEIFLASDDITRPVTDKNAKYVVKIEPHSNGPLFVEIHCLLNAGKPSEDEDASSIPDGMPEYIASGSHMFKDVKYRFLVLPRFKYDLHSVVKVHKKLDQKNILVIACQILDILQHLHDKGYVHSDIKAENLMIGSTERPKMRMHSNSNTSSAYVSSAASSSTTTSLHDFRKSTNKGDNFTNDNNPGVKCPIEFSGSNPIRSCRFNKQLFKESSLNYDEMVSSHYLRPVKQQVNYAVDDTDDESMKNGIFGRRRRLGKRNEDFYNSNSNISVYSSASVNSFAEESCGSSSGISSIMNKKNGHKNRRRIISYEDGEEESDNDEEGEEDSDSNEKRDRMYLIDFGLASKYVDSTGIHRPFFMDERRAHDGTLEFTSRDAHLGAHARRSDLECLGYNLICWSQGELPWKNEKLMQQPEEVHHMKEFFMSNVKEMLKLCYGPSVPKYLGVYMDYVNKLMYNDRPDYDYCRSIFRSEFKRLGYSPATQMHIDFEQYRATEKAVKRSPKALRNGVAAVGVAVDQLDGGEIGKNGLNRLKISVGTGTNDLLVKFGLMVPSVKENHSNKISPKNLRSKKNSPKRKRKKMSWEELLATDPEQIARERIEKEFDEQDPNLELSVKYSGNPTYAILELENKLNGTLTASPSTEPNSPEQSFLEVTPIKGFTKPMMDIVRKRHSNLMRSLIKSKPEFEDSINTSSSSQLLITPPSSRRRKSGLRPQVKSTTKSLFYHKNLLKQRLMENQRLSARRLASANNVDESCDSNSSSAVVVELVKKTKKQPVFVLLDTEDEEATTSTVKGDSDEEEKHGEDAQDGDKIDSSSCDKNMGRRIVEEVHPTPPRKRGRPRKYPLVVPQQPPPPVVVNSKRNGKLNEKTKSMRTLTRG